MAVNAFMLNGGLCYVAATVGTTGHYAGCHFLSNYEIIIMPPPARSIFARCTPVDGREAAKHFETAVCQSLSVIHYLCG